MSMCNRKGKDDKWYQNNNVLVCENSRDDFVKITTVCCNKCNKQINTEYQSFVKLDMSSDMERILMVSQ